MATNGLIENPGERETLSLGKVGVDMALGASRDGSAEGDANGVRVRGDNESDSGAEPSESVFPERGEMRAQRARDPSPTRTSNVPHAYSWEPHDMEPPKADRVTLSKRSASTPMNLAAAQFDIK